MRKFFKAVLIIGAIALVAFFMGSRPDQTINIAFNPAGLPDDLEGYLAETEKTVADLVPGAEKEIIWADAAAKSKTPLAIVYVHGFSATKHEIRPVPDKVAEALGANLYFTRLTGHGRDGEGLSEATLSDWADDFAEAIAIGERLGEKVVVMATSNGGALTTWGLSRSEFSSKIASVVLVSPAYELHGISTRIANIPWAESLLPLIGGEQRSWEPRNALHGKWWTTRYPSRSIFPMTTLLNVLKGVDVSSFNQPALFIYSPKDKVVISDEITRIAAQWGGKAETMLIETAGDDYDHVVTGDILSPDNTNTTTDRILQWISALN